jgi:hypothetical protein
MVPGKVVLNRLSVSFDRMDNSAFTFRLIFSIIALAAGIVSTLVIIKLRQGHDKAMVSFQLKGDKAVTDFKIFFYANLFMVISYLSFWYGSLSGNETIVFWNRYSLAIYMTIFTLLVGRWWRQF